MRRRFLKNAIRNDCIIFEVLSDFISFGLSRNPIEYSLDDGISWVKLNAGELTPTYTNIPRILIKCNPVYIGLHDGIGCFTVHGEFNLSGNVMALLGGHHYLKEKIFYGLFQKTSVVNVSKTFLPATTLAEGCYQEMFYGCTSLTTAPELPATTLVDNCYMAMFYNCSKLNYIRMLATDISASSCLGSWVYGVASTGTFVKNPEATWEKYGDSGIPDGWKVVMDGEESGEWGEEITFYFDTIPFGDYYTLTARDGMTWADWVESEYNTIGAELYEFEDEGYSIVTWNDLTISDYWNGTIIKTTDKIISEETYGIV